VFNLFSHTIETLTADFTKLTKRLRAYADKEEQVMLDKLAEAKRLSEEAVTHNIVIDRARSIAQKIEALFS
jgi:hypothetical protein